MSTLIPRIDTLERHSDQIEKDIRHIYVELKHHSRELRWLREGITSLLAHAGLDPPADEEE